VARIELWNGDICDLEVDAIVSPASTSLWMSTGVAGELKRVGGDQIEFAAVRQAPVELGDAIVTPAGNLAAKVVIHAVSLERDRRTNEAALDRAARNAMARVRELGLASVAFPALGTGIGGFPIREAARIAVDAVRDELATPSSIEHVIFALRGATAYEAFARALSVGVPSPAKPLLEPVPWQSVGPGTIAESGERTAVGPGKTAHKADATALSPVEGLPSTARVSTSSRSATRSGAGDQARAGRRAAPAGGGGDDGA
jgi:O-acetyl-ADP-ribose deacetylase (regulator of RNase III)